ncbi:DUF262 domain-containing protein [Pseudomonas fragi]|uniref:DUF262 domain-containing protein n=1 Tax=Pseudomonas fragi TaxID=296 RepID=UPI0014730417|nr:DUF262 domain-containing protein [Pseudomonas fragi]NNB17734.1 DUF262 domain-containing protein [Pseudomonas fragi]NNB19626.1 DUF262 domain-containing protein [Pseudomonas fragi]
MAPDEELIEQRWDEEDTLGEQEAMSPWDPSKIRISTRNLSLREVVAQIEGEEIDLAPEFQREFVWKLRQQTRLVESIMLGIPLPAFYFNQDLEGAYQVIDGVQRLTTIQLFMSGKLVLQGKYMEYLTGLDNYKFHDLDVSLQRRFRSSQIVVHVIEPQTPDDIKYDIFNRVNTLGTPLSAQEIRHAMSKSASRKFLSTLTSLPSFDLATDYSFWKKTPDGDVPDTNRMMNRELALRFCAFTYYESKDYKTFASMDAYLADFLKRIDGRSEPDRVLSRDVLDHLKRTFDAAMINAKMVMGSAAFRRLGSSRKRGPINRAIFEAQALALAEVDPARLKAKAKVVTNYLLKLFDDDEYVRSVTSGTGAAYKIEYRLSQTRHAVKEALK